MTKARYQCTICGSENDMAEPHRELNQCPTCHGNSRFRGIAYALQQTIFRNHDPLTKQPPRKGIRALGFSDSPIYADHCERLFDYTNCFFHQNPLLDITKSEHAARFGQFDLIICSDVFEHIVAPVSSGLKNLRSLLRDNGTLIFSVPYLDGYETIEHFPHLSDGWSIEDKAGEYILTNTRPDGLKEVHRGLSFHGGPGTVLEMRIFGEGDLFSQLQHAGFRSIKPIEAALPNIGYVWDATPRHPLHRGRSDKSYILVCCP